MNKRQRKKDFKKRQLAFVESFNEVVRRVVEAMAKKKQSNCPVGGVVVKNNIIKRNELEGEIVNIPDGSKIIPKEILKQISDKNQYIIISANPISTEFINGKWINGKCRKGKKNDKI